MDHSDSIFIRLRLTTQVMVSYILVVLMMVSFALVFVNVIESLAPAWNGSYVILMAFLVSLEALISYRLIKNSSALDSSPVIMRVSEFVVILILTKVFSYLFSNPAQLLIDARTWSQNIGSFLLQGGYLFILIYLAIIWALTGAFAGTLVDLEEDETLYELERRGEVRTDRLDARRRLLGYIFGIGCLMFFMTTLSNVQVALPFLVTKPLADLLFQNIAATMVFFFLGFALLAQGQYSILRARWYIEAIPVNQGIASRWIIYSLVSLAGIGLIATILPTSYSLSLLDILRGLMGVLFSILAILQMICFAPIAALLALLSRLFSSNPNQQPSAPAQPTPVPTPIPVAGPASSWIEVVKSIVFWGIFIAIVFFAFRHYFGQRRGIWQAVRKFHLWSWSSHLWDWIKRLVTRANQQMAGWVEKGISRIQALTKARSIHIDPLLTLSSRLPPRQRILLIYLSMLHWNSQNGFPRKGNQTPLEYSHTICASFPEVKDDFAQLTSAFLEARYTRHALSHSQAGQAQTTLERIQAALRSQLEQDQTSHH